MSGTNGNNGSRPMNLAVFPEVQWADYEYTLLRMRLDLYDDMILATRYKDGQPSGEAFCVDPGDVTTALSGVPLSSGLLPRNCLFWGRREGQERVGIWVEPRVWAVSVEGQQLTWFVPMPALVWVGAGLQYNLFAVRGGTFPLPEDELYMAPCPNVYGDRGVCEGSAPFPIARASTIWEAVETFFSSGFNNHLANRKSREFPDNILAQWKRLFEAGAATYPEDDLMEAGKKLKEVSSASE